LSGEIDGGKNYAVTEHVGNFQRSIRDNKWQLIETMPTEKWLVKLNKKSRQKIADKIMREGNILLIRNEDNKKNRILDYPQEALRLKKEYENILARV
jgi:hypothetical protein